MPPLGVILCEYLDKLYLFRNEKDCPTKLYKPHDRMFIHLDTVPECDGQAEFLELLQRCALRAML